MMIKERTSNRIAETVMLLRHTISSGNPFTAERTREPLLM
jgi:hypothetical protein